MSVPTLRSVIERLERVPDQMDNRNKVLGLHPFDTIPNLIRECLADLRKIESLPDPLGEALNSGDGTYRP